MKKLTLLLLFVTLSLFGFTQNQLNPKYQSVTTDSIRALNDSTYLLSPVSGGTVVLDSLKAKYIEGVTFPGLNNELLISDGIGGTKTDIGLNFDGVRFIASAVSNNTFIGYQSGNISVTGANNIMFGTQSGTAITSGQSNVGVGSGTLRSLTTGFNNVALGNSAGGGSVISGDSSVFIGSGAGYFEDQSNRLYISNHDTQNKQDGIDNSLIYGEFDNNYLQVNGILNIASENFYIAPTGDTTDVNTWKYTANSDSLTISVNNGVDWDIIMILSNQE